MHRFIVLGLAAVVVIGTGFASSSAISVSEKDRKAVERACLDYVEGVYEVKPDLIARGVHRDLKKYGYWRRDPSSEYQGTAMTYKQLFELAQKYNAEGRVPKDAPKEVTVLDVLDKTASAKLVAHWGIDYFHLVKEDGEWKIRQVMWQSHPAN